MKKFLLGTVGLVALGFAAPASAADLAARPYTKAPPMIAAIYDWSGFYIGANGGWGSSRKCWDFVMPPACSSLAEGCHDATGGTAGGQIGYRWQAAHWVFGLEAQGNWADFHGRNVSLAVPGASPTTPASMPSACSPARSVTPVNNALLYVKGGAAVTCRSLPALATATGMSRSLNNVDDTRWGGVVGVGLEYGFAPNWSAGSRIRSHVHAGHDLHLHDNGVRPAGALRAPSASVRTSISSPCASTIAGVARSSRSTDLRDPISI